MQPSDSPAASAAAPVPLADGLPWSGRWFWTDPACVRRRRMRRRRWGSGPPWTPTTLHGQAGVSQVTGSSSANVPRSATPPRETPPRPVAVASPAAFRVGDPLGFPGRTISGLYPRGPRACLPTHQPPRCRGGCKAGYRPAGLGFDRAGFVPAGRQTEFRELNA